MQQAARRITVASAAALTIVVAGLISAAHSFQHRFVVAIIHLNVASGDIILDEEHQRLLVVDAIDSPQGGTYGRPVLKVIDASTGRVVRILPLMQGVSAPVLDVAASRLLGMETTSGGHPFKIVTVSTMTGRTIYATTLPTPPSLPPKWSQHGYGLVGSGELGSIVVNAAAGYLVAITRRLYESNNHYYPDTGVFVLDLHTGALRRTIRLPGIPADVALDPAAQRAFITDGTSGALWLVNPASGTVPRALFAHGVYGIVVDPAVHRALAVDAVGLRILDTHDGRLLATIPGSFGPPMPVLVPGGQAVVASSMVAPLGRAPAPATIRLIDIRQRRVLWMSRLSGAPWALAVDQQRGRIFAATCRGAFPSRCAITILTLTTGAVQRIFNIPALLYSMAVDGRTGYLLIETQGAPPLPVNDFWTALRNHVPFDLPFLPKHTIQPTMSSNSVHGTITVLDVDA